MGLAGSCSLFSHYCRGKLRVFQIQMVQPEGLEDCMLLALPGDRRSYATSAACTVGKDPRGVPSQCVTSMVCSSGAACWYCLWPPAMHNLDSSGIKELHSPSHTLVSQSTCNIVDMTLDCETVALPLTYYLTLRQGPSSTCFYFLSRLCK